MFPAPSPRIGAVEASAVFTQAMLPALREAVDHPDMTEELAEILSTRAVEVEYEVSTDVDFLKGYHAEYGRGLDDPGSAELSEFEDDIEE